MINIEKTGLLIELLGILCFILLTIFSSFGKIAKKQDFGVQEESRSSIIDFIRGIAMFGIVIIHIDSYFQVYHAQTFEIQITRLLSNLSRFSVPAFIFSSAFFLKWKGAGNLWKSRFFQLIIPYAGISFAGYFTKYPPLQFFQKFPLKLLLGQTFQPYYYVPLMLELYLLYSLFFKNIHSWKKSFYLGTLILCAGINFWSNHFFPRENNLLNEIYPISFTHFIFFFVLGFSAKSVLTSKTVFQKEFNTATLLVILISILFYLVPVSYYSFTENIEISNHFLFYPVAVFILLTKIGYWMESKKDGIASGVFQFFSYIGKNSLSIFLLHPIVIHLMHIFDPFLMGGFIVSWALTLVMNIGIPLLVWTFIEKTSALLKRFLSNAPSPD